MKPTPSTSRFGTSSFDLRRQSLQIRVNEAAKALHDQGIRPTVAGVRISLGGGSPNDLAPALKQWRDVELPKLSTAGATTPPATLPLQIVDLAQEIWRRALAAAVLETRLGAKARDALAYTAETEALRLQLSSVRDQLQRESLAYGELRAQAARHEVIAREALSREQSSAARERELVRQVGALQQRIAELEATLDQRHGRARGIPDQNTQRKPRTPPKKLRPLRRGSKPD